MSIVILLIQIVAALIILAISYMKWRHQYWQRRNIPFIPPTIPFGNLEQPWRKKHPIGHKIKQIYDHVKKKGWKHCGLYFFANPVYLVVDLEYVKNVMVRDFSHFGDRGMYYNEKADPISAHLFALGGEKWRYLRTKLSPTFTAGKMKKMFPILLECVQLLMESMEEKQNPLDVKQILSHFTIDVIGACAFGLNCNTMKEEDSPFRVYSKKIFAPSKLRSLKMLFISNAPKLGHLLGIRQISPEIASFFTKIVKDTVKYRERNKISRPDFMQLLIDLRNDGQSVTIEEIVAQSFSFFVAGFETSASTMTFLLYELAKNEQIQEKLREEIVSVLAKSDNQITYEAITEMTYLDQVVEEGLRKYPPLPFVTRTCIKDYKIPNTQIIIEKGRRVILPILALHHDPDYYPEPDKFDPERFNDENRQMRPSYTYIPFGEGPRICIGMRFGLIQTKIGLVALLHKYRFTLNQRMKEPLKMSLHSFNLSAQDGIWLDSQKI